MTNNRVQAQFFRRLEERHWRNNGGWSHQRAHWQQADSPHFQYPDPATLDRLWAEVKLAERRWNTLPMDELMDNLEAAYEAYESEKARQSPDDSGDLDGRYSVAGQVLP